MIVATSGHVDHGKTSLIRALTGVITDRLPEEKRRSMSIDLGFAYAELEPGGPVVGFIDVPGHQRFLRNMLCGLHAIDFALLVVAADDGPMPQTRQHLAILDLLEVGHGAVVITKTDRVSADRLRFVSNELAAVLRGTSLSDAPHFPVSTLTGAGVSRLKSHLNATALTWCARPADGNFRLAVDRTFTLVGVGLTVTGTVVSGAAQLGDALRIASSRGMVRVRSIHANGRPAIQATVGQRCAISVTGDSRHIASLARGDWLTGSGAPGMQSRLDVRMRVANEGTPTLAHSAGVALSLGASEVGARVFYLQKHSVEAGATGWMQVVTDRPIGAAYGDRFIVRDPSSKRILGGGRVIDIFAPSRGRSKPERLQILEAMDSADPLIALKTMLEVSASGISWDQFVENRNLTVPEAEAMKAEAQCVLLPAASGRIVLSARRLDEIQRHLTDQLEQWHARFPQRPGASLRTIYSESPAGLHRDTALAIADHMVRSGMMARSGANFCLPSHRPRLSESDEEMWQRIAPILRQGALRPPSVAEIGYLLALPAEIVEEMLLRMMHWNRVVRVAPNRFYLYEAIRELGDLMTDLAAQGDEGLVMAKRFRDESGIGRNLTIQVLEFFDAVGFTRRVGAGRRIVRPEHPLIAFGQSDGGS